jgi:hypothetical protein
VSSDRLSLMARGHYRSRRILWGSFLGAIVGGAAAFSLSYAGLGPWGLLIGVVLIVVVAGLVARVDSPLRFLELVVITVCCCVLTWPVVWIAVVFVRYWITGQSVGS